MMMNVEQVDAVLSIVATLIPIALAVFATFFGIQSRRRKSAPAPSLTIAKFEREQEVQGQIRNRRRWQIFELSLAVLVTVLLLIFTVVQYVRTDPPGDMPALLDNLAIVGLVLIILFYAGLVWLIVRTLGMVMRTPAGELSEAEYSTTLVIEAEKSTLVMRTQSALRRFNAVLQRVDTESGTFEARKYFLFNLNQEFFDRLTIKLTPEGDKRCELTVSSDGIMPSFKSSHARNRENVEQLIALILK
jgi:hypothetical protein